MIPAASVATSVTSASPIISAAAVDAVRCGFRRAFSAPTRVVERSGDDPRELRRPLGLPPRQRLAEPHDEDDHQHERVDQRTSEEREDAQERAARPPGAVAEKPVREREERPDDDREQEDRPPGDR